MSTLLKAAIRWLVRWANSDAEPAPYNPAEIDKLRR